MIPCVQIINAIAFAVDRKYPNEAAMPLKPRIKVKAKGIPIGNYAEVVDAAGKQKIKPKRKAMGAATEIAKRKRRKWRAAK